MSTGFKDAWLRAYLRCLNCEKTPLARGDELWRCESCDATYPDSGKSSTFITAALAAEFNIVDNERASDHPYNPTAVRLIEEVTAIGGMALDCGAGSRTFVSEHLIQTEIMPYANVDVLAVNQSLPFVDDCFDVIFSFDVLEHVSDPFLAARELTRVLKPGGIVYIDLPFLQIEHGYPYHYFNATRMGLRQLFAGLLTAKAHVIPASGHPAHLIWTALNTYRNGLPKALRPEFEEMTIGQLLGQPWKSLRDSEYGRQLAETVAWRLASTTQAIFEKEQNSSGNSALSVEIDTLPNFIGRADDLKASRPA